MDEAAANCHVEWHYGGTDIFLLLLFSLMQNPSVKLEQYMLLVPPSEPD